MRNDDSTLGASPLSSPSIVEFRCPACRARQPVQETCRRCHADLALLAKIHRRMDHLARHPCPAHDQELATLTGKAAATVA